MNFNLAFGKPPTVIGFIDEFQKMTVKAKTTSRLNGFISDTSRHCNQQNNRSTTNNCIEAENLLHSISINHKIKHLPMNQIKYSDRLCLLCRLFAPLNSVAK